MKLKKVLSTMQMKEIYIQRSAFERNNSKISGKSLEIEFERGRKQLEDSLFQVILNTHIHNTANEFSIDLSVVGIFDVSKVDASMCETLLDKNTYAILFPFVRSQVTLLTSQPGMQPIVLPAININSMIEASSEIDIEQ